MHTHTYSHTYKQTLSPSLPPSLPPSHPPSLSPSQVHELSSEEDDHEEGEFIIEEEEHEATDTEEEEEDSGEDHLYSSLTADALHSLTLSPRKSGRCILVAQHIYTASYMNPHTLLNLELGIPGLLLYHAQGLPLPCVVLPLPCVVLCCVVLCCRLRALPAELPW